jgi:hypothetical protein
MLQIGTRTLFGESSEYEILGFVPPDFKTLDSIYNEFVTVSFVVDRYKEEKDEKKKLYGQPSYTPQLACPDLISMGLLDSLNADRWPHGRYSVTLMIDLEIDETGDQIKAGIADAMVLTYVQRADNEKEVVFVELQWEALQGGHAINVITDSAVAPCDIDVLADIMSTAATAQELGADNEVVSEEELHQMIMKAKQQGEDVGELEEILRMRPEDLEEDENKLDPMIERLMTLRQEEM